MATAVPTARDLARETVRASILAAARARLTDEGPAQLSLRAVARDVGMVSSAVYRYVASRDDLLTALLIAGYDELGAAVEEADAAHPRDAHGARWVASCRAIRTWSIAHPGDFALLYGSPVPGYAAPQDTIEPAARVITVLVRAVVDAARAGAVPVPPRGTSATVGDVVAGATGWVADRLDLPDADPELVVRTLMAWTTVFGTISFELFGHLVGSVDDTAAYFDQVIARLAGDLGFDVDVS
ncbi:MAG: TetR/AcrR family transcriptional regulator [Williamsia herbipolensis]|nr:TetR/AcrR family transcriptional regulator [Williamsia herbipolensis]